MAYVPVSPDDFATTAELDDWQYVDDAIHGYFRAPSFSDAGALASRIAGAADAANHHPDMELSYPGVVHVTLTTHDAGGVTDADVELALKISAFALQAGATPTTDD